MSLENEVSALTAAVNALTATYDGKISDIDAKVNGTVQDITDWLAGNAKIWRVYIDTIAGDDANDGSEAAPVKTFSRAQALLRPSYRNNQVWIREGQTVDLDTVVSVGVGETLTFVRWGTAGGVRPKVRQVAALGNGYPSYVSLRGGTFIADRVDMESLGDDYNWSTAAVPQWAYMGMIWALSDVSTVILDKANFTGGAMFGTWNSFGGPSVALHILTEGATCQWDTASGNNGSAFINNASNTFINLRQHNGGFSDVNTSAAQTAASIFRSIAYGTNSSEPKNIVTNIDTDRTSLGL